MSRRSFILFLKAMCSAQIASAVDFMATLALVNFCGLYYVYATFLGALSGGVVNCCINYKWVFCVSSSKCHIALKYMLVWGGSIILNTYGTYFLTECIMRMAWVGRLTNMYVSVNLFLLPKVVVALIVSFFWNYQLQRKFVYRDCFFDKLFISHKR